jgi:hypothetical protein
MNDVLLADEPLHRPTGYFLVPLATVVDPLLRETEIADKGAGSLDQSALERSRSDGLESHNDHHASRCRDLSEGSDPAVIVSRRVCAKRGPMTGSVK